MNEASSKSGAFCPNCGCEENEPEARFCMGCGCRLGSDLLAPPIPPKPQHQQGFSRGDYIFSSLLWTAPTYNAYCAVKADDLNRQFTVIEQGNSLPGPNDGRSRPTSSDAAVEAKDRNGRNGAWPAKFEPETYRSLGLLEPKDILTEEDRVL